MIIWGAPAGTAKPEVLYYLRNLTMLKTQEYTTQIQTNMKN